MFRIIEFYTTDPHKAYFTHIGVIYELFRLFISIKIQSEYTTNKRESADW